MRDGARVLLESREPLIVVSPHLDDGVFGCGCLLADHPGSVVITVFAARPETYAGITRWDRDCGFEDGQDVMALRRDEDGAAMAHLEARSCWLDFLDAQYAPSPPLETLAGVLATAIAQAGIGTVVVPLGLFHSDHALTHTAALEVMRRQPHSHWFAYAEPMYRRVPRELIGRLRGFRAAGIRAQPIVPHPLRGQAAKSRAVAEYRSQLRGLSRPPCSGYGDVYAPERYYELQSC